MRQFFLGVCVLLMGCSSPSVDIRPVEGTLDEPVAAQPMPEEVSEAIAEATRLHQYELLNDEQDDISVWVLEEVDNGIPTQGYGITVVRGAKSTTIPEIFHGKNPSAWYNKAGDFLWLACGQMEGTGTLVEAAFRLCFHDDGSAYIDDVVEPYQIQQLLCERLSYSVEGEQISFFDKGGLLCTATNTVTDMRGLDEEQPIWIGEQIQFAMSEESVQVHVTPGVKFVTGLVLTYDDMPTFSVPVTMAEDGTVMLGEISIEE